jgi:hypothetical protein
LEGPISGASAVAAHKSLRHFRYLSDSLVAKQTHGRAHRRRGKAPLSSEIAAAVLSRAMLERGT